MIAQQPQGKLSALEGLIWGSHQQTASPGWRARQLQLLRFLVAICLRNVAVEVTDVSIQYVQTGDPAPVILRVDDGSANAVGVSVRTITLGPVVIPKAAAAAAAAGPKTPQDGLGTGCDDSSARVLHRGTLCADT